MIRLFIPKGMAAFVSFEESGFNPTEFLFLVFPSGGAFRAPGSDSIVGSFPHDQAFSVAVNLNVGPTSTAKVTLLGLAHGSVDVAIQPQVSDAARRFSAVKLATDIETARSSFFANDISVIYSPH
jgi:hypothetical protein